MVRDMIYIKRRTSIRCLVDRSGMGPEEAYTCITKDTVHIVRFCSVIYISISDNHIHFWSHNSSWTRTAAVPLFDDEYRFEGNSACHKPKQIEWEVCFMNFNTSETSTFFMYDINHLYPYCIHNSLMLIRSTLSVFALFAAKCLSSITFLCYLAYKLCWL